MKVKAELDKNSLKQIANDKKNFEKGVLVGVRNAMLFVERESKSSFGKPGNLKVKSGLLRSSIYSKVQEARDKIIGSVGSNVIYAPVHEFGNFKTPARPFIEPAFSNNIERINELIVSSIDKEVKL